MSTSWSRFALERWLAEMAETIIEAGLHPSAWPKVTERFSAQFPGVKAVFHAFDQRARLDTGLVQSGFPRQSIDEYGAHYCHLNPWLPFWLTAQIGRAYASDDVLPSGSFSETEFYRIGYGR